MMLVAPLVTGRPAGRMPAEGIRQEVAGFHLAFGLGCEAVADFAEEVACFVAPGSHPGKFGIAHCGHRGIVVHSGSSAAITGSAFSASLGVNTVA